MDDDDATLLQYDHSNPEEIARPEQGLYGKLEDARNQVRSLSQFSDAILMYSDASSGAATSP